MKTKNDLSFLKKRYLMSIPKYLYLSTCHVPLTYEYECKSNKILYLFENVVLANT